VRHEAASIQDDTKALLFALDSLSGLLPHAIAAHLFHRFAEGSTAMNLLDATMRRPRMSGVLCAIGAALLGLAYMAIAGAPMRYLGINIGALAIGLTMLGMLGHAATADRRLADAAIVTIAGALLVTALLGSEVDGAARWVNLAGLAIQPSLILLPVMLVAFARTRSATATTGIVIAAVAMALQPDRAMAGMLALCVTVLAVIRSDRHTVIAVAAGVASFATTLMRADTLPAAPYVDQILYSSFDVHPGAALAVWGGAALMLVPGIVGFSRDPDNRTVYAAFGAAWFAAIVAAALGNYPTPVVGYGGSAIIGYMVSLFALPKLSGAPARKASREDEPANRSPSDRHLLDALA
jgi:cell division protein FtsW (lipid II flippase)